MPKLGLGTVQFGQPYGVSNRAGQVPLEVVDAILQRAAKAHIEWLDTAASYGEAERVLSKLDLSPFRIVTKTIRARGDVALVVERVKESLKSLGRVDRLLIHFASDLQTPVAEELWAALLDLRDQGLVGAVGISVYVEDEPLALARKFRPQVMQVPLSLLDQRLIKDGTIQALKELGVEIHARSIFLQGLLLMRSWPECFKHLRTKMMIRKTYMKNAGITPLRAALGFIFSRPEVDVALVGVTSVGELDEILEGCALPCPALDWGRFAINDEVLLNPSRWP